MSSIQDEEFRRRKLEEAIEVKSLRRIISAYLFLVQFTVFSFLPAVFTNLDGCKGYIRIAEECIAYTREEIQTSQRISEVYALTGGIAPLMPAIDANHLKRKAQSDNEKITWQWLSFTNSARKDDLQLYHCVRVVNGVPPTGDYSFAKYNKSVDVIKYTDEEYDKHLTHMAWTKEETDQLFDLCERFDLRFVIIADRFPSSKTVVELKDRYYSESRAIVNARASAPGDAAGHPLIKEPYVASQETERKRALSMLLSHTQQQERKDVNVSADVCSIICTRGYIFGWSGYKPYSEHACKC